MIIKIMILTCLFSGISSAETFNEEAIILNQELSFLEESANNVGVSSRKTEEAERADSVETSSLERTFFRDTEKDEIRTKSAAPKRRSF